MFRSRPAIGSTRRARRLRRNKTDAEARLWWVLRECFPESRFRFQSPIGPYIGDFCSHRAKLIVEVDGSQHSDARDRARTEWLMDEGYELLRFWNNDVLSNPGGVATLIGNALDRRHPSPPPPPQGEGKE
jgi:very-short-patch-repair endonuclease